MPGQEEQGFFADLDPDQRRAFQTASHSRRFPRGTTLFNEGESSDKVVVVVSGRVKISFFTNDGREIVLGVRGPGEILGELSALDGEPRSATATALEDVDSLIVTTDAFRAFIETHPKVALRLLETISRRLRDADDKRIEFGALDTVGRVAKRLIELASRFGEETGEGLRISVALSQQDLAGWTGASREAVSKAMQTLRTRGWIETHRRGVTILDLDSLRRRAG